MNIRLLQYWLTLLILLLFVASSTESEQFGEYIPQEASYTPGDTLTISGILIDSHCYSLDKENTGHDHHLPQSGFRVNCAEYCALQGYPAGELNRNQQGDDEMWIIMAAAQIFADYMTQTVRVEVTVRSDGILDPLRVELKSDRDNWIRIM